MALFKVFFWGLIISFLGTLPLGPLNVTAMQLSLQEGVTTAMYFSIGTIVSELIYLRLGVAGLKWIKKQKKIFDWMQWITLALLLALAAGSFYAAAAGSDNLGNFLLKNNINHFLLGMMMGALTVAHIPFWFGWSTILFTKNILRSNSLFYNIYTVAAGLGTFLANLLFIYGGFFIVNTISAKQHTINNILGWVFVVTAIAQFVTIVWRKPIDKKASLE